MKKLKYCIYVLYSPCHNHLYVGYTGNLRRRLKQHAAGQVASTRKIRPFSLIHSEYFLLKTDALRREAYFKSRKGQVALELTLAEAISVLKNNTTSYLC